MEITLKIKANVIDNETDVHVSLLEENDTDVRAYHLHRRLPKESTRFEYQRTVEAMIKRCLEKMS